MTDQQMIGLYFRRRDKYGRLKRKSGRKRVTDSGGAPLGWMAMYRQVWTRRGLGPEEVEEKLKDYLRRNPPWDPMDRIRKSINATWRRRS